LTNHGHPAGASALLRWPVGVLWFGLGFNLFCVLCDVGVAFPLANAGRTCGGYHGWSTPGPGRWGAGARPGIFGATIIF
jgi:hypothetical protein